MVFVKRDYILGEWQLFETCISLGNASVLRKVKGGGVIIDLIANGEYLYSNTDQVRGVLPCEVKYEVIEIQTNSTWHTIDLFCLESWIS